MTQRPDPLRWWLGVEMPGSRLRAGKIPDRNRGCLTYAATCSAVRGGPSYWCGLASACGVEGRAGLVTPAMKRSATPGAFDQTELTLAELGGTPEPVVWLFLPHVIKLLPIQAAISRNR